VSEGLQGKNPREVCTQGAAGVMGMRYPAARHTSMLRAALSHVERVRSLTQSGPQLMAIKRNADFRVVPKCRTYELSRANLHNVSNATAA
jgi:hypothetical protein